MFPLLASFPFLTPGPQASTEELALPVAVVQVGLSANKHVLPSPGADM